ncbi:hypothetical protein GCM10009808_16640 [Microbacterium sediminicola]|uniref:Signal peptidase I n=1 Tax=Microbacterium sediminicola TaxID=415210 RepID=A0ABN2I6W0_9MICO
MAETRAELRAQREREAQEAATSRGDAPPPPFEDAAPFAETPATARPVAPSESVKKVAVDKDGKREKGIWSYLGMGISAGLLLLAIAVAALVVVVPAVTNSVSLTVLTNSMEPTYPPGTLLVVTPTDPQDIRIGDVITYQLVPGEATYVTHRVVAVTQSTNGDVSFTTKGDNNGTIDEDPVIADQVMGRVWYSLPWLGWINNAVAGLGRSWLIVGAAVALFAYAGWMFTSGYVKKRRERNHNEEVFAATEPER